MMPAPIQAPIQPPSALRVQLRVAAEHLWLRTLELRDYTPASELEQLAIGFDGARRTALKLSQSQSAQREQV